MLEAARSHRVPVERVSFAGSLAAARRYGEALRQTRSKRQRQCLLEEMFSVFAADLVPDRPDRREPRAGKRRLKPYALPTSHRHKFRDVEHRDRHYLKSPPRFKFQKDSRE